MNRIFQTTTGVLAAGIIAVACSTSPPGNPEVAEASINTAAQSVNRAAANPNVAKYASNELQNAQDSLKQAQVTWQEKKDEPATSHLASLAHQQAETAIQLGSQRAVEEEAKLASAQRNDMPAGTQGTAEGTNMSSGSSGSSDTAKSNQELQQELAGVPAQVSERRVSIEGHADSTGPEPYNKALARDRAGVVRAALIRHGIHPDRIFVRSLGEENPVASNDNGAGRRENRRTDILISDTQGRLSEPVSSSGK